VAFHWARRERVFDRDILRFGTATLVVLLFATAELDYYRWLSPPNRCLSTAQRGSIVSCR
jgi:hypothetical protein